MDICHRGKQPLFSCVWDEYRVSPHADELICCVSSAVADRQPHHSQHIGSGLCRLERHLAAGREVTNGPFIVGTQKLFLTRYNGGPDETR